MSEDGKARLTHVACCMGTQRLYPKVVPLWVHGATQTLCGTGAHWQCTQGRRGSNFLLSIVLCYLHDRAGIGAYPTSTASAEWRPLQNQ